MTNGWYMYPAFNAFYKVEGNGNEGRGFRWFVDAKQTKLEFFTFEERTANFIADGVEAKTVVACEEKEYLTELQKFLKWQQNALLALENHPDLRSTLL